MIFNPLFLNESGNSKLLIPSSKKLSQNKYLFSDIVKVVMNPINEIQKLPSASKGLLALQRGLTVSEGQIPVKVKLNFLKDIHPEMTDKSLAELLPKEIVKLFEVKGKTPDNNDAVSYISQEILGGELHTFVKDLLGADFIKNNLKQDNGLLLSLEDKTSAVNFELAKVDSKYTSNPQIAVQTIVVPIKSKLFSKFAAENNDATFFRFNNQETTKLDGLEAQKLKPVISVYSFKLGTEDFHSLTQTINKTRDLSHSSEIKSVKSNPLGEYKKNLPDEIKYTNQKLDRELLAKNLAKSKLFQTSKEKSDFTVNNITIVKKSANSNEVIDANKSKEMQNILVNKELSHKNNALREVNNQIENNLINSNEISTKDGYLKQRGLNVPKDDSSTINRTIQSFDQKKNLNPGEIEILPKVEKHKMSILDKKDGKKESKVNGEKIIENFSDKGKIVKSNLPMDDQKKQIPENEENVKNKAENSKPGKPDQLNNTSTKIIEDNFVKEASIILKNKSKFSDANKISESTGLRKASSASESESQSKNVINENRVIENIIGSKTNGDHQIKSDSRIERIHTENNKNYENVEKNDSTTAGTKDEFTNKKLINNPNFVISENVRSEIDKKELSVKVKSEVKSVSDKKLSSKVDSKLSSRSDSNTQSAKDNSLQNNVQDEIKNGLKIENDYNKTDNSFSSVLGKINSSQSINLSESQIVPNHAAVKIVKSVEIVKELSKFITKQEKGSLTFNIKPEHLGQLKITLDLIDNALKARIEVENEQAKQLLEKNVDKLQQELIDNGVKLNSLNISLSNSKRQKDDKELKNRSNNNSKTLGQVGESEEEIKKKSLGYNTYEYIA